MEAHTFVRNAWYVLGLSEEFAGGRLHGQTIAGKPLVMWRTAFGQVVVFDGRCLHKRMPLKEGKLLPDDILECAYHGFCYDAEGRCVRVPAHPEGRIPAAWKLKAYPLVEQDGVVWVWSGDPEKIGNVCPPRTPEIGSPEWETISSGPVPVAANYRLLIENLLDITHFYPLHDGNIGDIANSRIPIELIEEDIGGNQTVKTVRHATQYKQPPYFADWFGYDVVDRYHTHHMMNPGLTRVQLRVAPPGQLSTDAERGYVLYHTHTPVDQTHLIWRWILNCRVEHRAGSEPSRSLARSIAETFPVVVDQDRWVLERQQEMFGYPDEGYSEVHVRTDKALLVARKILAALEKHEQAR